MQTRGSASLLGIDFSAYQTITNQTTLFSASPNLVYLRAYGTDHSAPDSTFINRVQLYKTTNIPTGGYYFCTPETPITVDNGAECDAQCDQFISILQQAYGQGQYGDLIPMLDCEAWGTTTPQGPMYYGVTGDQLIDWVKRFRDRFFNTTNRRLGFYSNRDFLTSADKMAITDTKLSEINDMPLWLAEYDKYYTGSTVDTYSPANLGGWSTYVLWQYSEDGVASDYGLSHPQNKVDLNRTDSVDRLKPPPPPTNVTANQTGDNTLQISFTRPAITDYLGADLYINGAWKQWLSKSATSDVFTVDITSYARNVQTSYRVVVEDDYSDFGYGTEQYITLYAPTAPPPPAPPPTPPPTTNTGVTSMPIVSMGTTLKKGTAAIGLLTSIDGLNLKADTVETTALDTSGAYRTFTSTFKDAGEVSLSGHFDYTGHNTLLADFESEAVNSYTIEFPDKGATGVGTTWAFSGVVTAFHTSADLDALVKVECTIKVSGKPTLTGPA